MTTYTVPFVINGLESVTPTTFPIISPVTGHPIHSCSSATPADALRAVDSAVAAFPAWSKTTPGIRRDIFIKAAAIMESRRAELAGYMKEEVGAVQAWADMNLSIAIDSVKDIAGRIATVEGMIPGTASSAVGAMIVKEPLGVVFAMAPWNAPIILGTRAIAFPLSVGNSVLFKASELSPRTHWSLVSCFLEAGVPPGALNLIVAPPTAAAAVTESIISHPAVKKINFTGSTSVGRIIGRLAGQHLKPVLLELGGKAPAIVWKDADLDLAAAQTALGAFINAGQICMSTERILVHKDVRATFEQKLITCIEQFFPSTADALILISKAGVTKNHAMISDAVAKGAKVLFGNPEAVEDSKYKMRPVVLADVTTEMDIYKTESFGPTVSLIEVDSEAEALRVANDTEYGLASAVFTKDLRQGLRFARGIETGAVHINSMTVHDESALPHGGVKASGYGRFNSIGLEEWVRTKNITYDL